LTAGIDAANRVLSAANAAVDRELRDEALEDLCARVDDWKNHRVDHFGDLLLYGNFPVVTGKSDVQKEVRSPSSLAKLHLVLGNSKGTIGAGSKDEPSPSRLYVRLDDDGRFKLEDDEEFLNSFKLSRLVHPAIPALLTSVFIPCLELISHSDAECCLITSLLPNSQFFLAKDSANVMGINCPTYEQYTIYLFERILLCCKEANPNKSKDKILGTQKDKKDKKGKVNKDGTKSSGKLLLKGRIFMTNVTEVIQIGKPGTIALLLIRPEVNMKQGTIPFRYSGKGTLELKTFWFGSLTRK
jgi:cell division control protein 24